MRHSRATDACRDQRHDHAVDDRELPDADHHPDQRDNRDQQKAQGEHDADDLRRNEGIERQEIPHGRFPPVCLNDNLATAEYDSESDSSFRLHSQPAGKVLDELPGHTAGSRASGHRPFDRLGMQRVG